MNQNAPNAREPTDALYAKAITEFGAALERLGRAYEADTEKRKDLMQEIHIELWRSLNRFEGRCSLRTWVYRVAHNTATSYAVRQRRSRARLMSLQELEVAPIQVDHGNKSAQHLDAERLLQVVQQLKPFDRQLLLLYLEEMDAASIGEVTGLSAGNVRIQIHRIKAILAKRFLKGGRYDI